MLDSYDDEERRKRHYALLTQPLPRQSLEITKNMSDEEWKRFWAVNVDGVFYCTRAALKRMEPQHYGRIINIASAHGLVASKDKSARWFWISVPCEILRLTASVVLMV